VKIYFVRHGESVGNKKGLFQTAEMPLSPTGIKQAQRVAKRLKDHKIDLICASTHTRTRQTAEIVSKEIHAPVEYWNELTELRNPSQMAGKPMNDPEADKIKNLIKENFTKEDWKFSDEETFSEVNARAEKIIRHLLQKKSEQNIVCVSHASITKAIIGRMVFGKDLTAQIFKDIRYHFWTTNTGITVCEYGKDKIWGITSWNDSSHL
jgi:probable phosphoglycerate mutase